MTAGGKLISVMALRWNRAREFDEQAMPSSVEMRWFGTSYILMGGE
jgi:hypothetical protein